MDLNRSESRPLIVDWLIADMLADALKPVPGRPAAKSAHTTRLRRAVARVWNKAASRRKWWS